MLPHFIKVDLSCNNTQGVFTGRLDGIFFGRWDEGNVINSPFDEEGDFEGIKIHFVRDSMETKETMCIGRLKIPLLRHYTSQASWCFDTIIISEDDFVKLLNYLRKKDFSMFEGESSLYDKFNDKERKEITLNDLLYSHSSGVVVSGDSSSPKTASEGEKPKV